MVNLKVISIFALVLVLNGIEGREKVEENLESKCRDDIQLKTPACQVFCKANPKKCLIPGKSINAHNRVIRESNVHIHVTTFNVGGNDPQNLRDWVHVNPRDPPDLIVIGLQEMIELNIQSIPTASKKEDKWVYALRQAIPDNYLQVDFVRLVGVFLVVYRNAASGFNFENNGHSTVGTGILKYGNKGGAGISMTLNKFHLCIVNCHLAAGQAEFQKRNSDFRAIAQKLRFSGPARGVYDHDAIIWMGDMNSRLNTDVARDKVVEACNTNKHAPLFKHDQLLQQREAGAIFNGFHELIPSFKPTYKYDNGTNTFDTSPKQRLPAWCDRILHWKKTTVEMQQLTYESKQNVLFSDHKPVQALLRLNLAG